MARPIALITSDWHIHDWKQFNKDDVRIDDNKLLIADMFLKAEELKLPIFFAGDLTHTPQALSVKTLDTYMEFFGLATAIKYKLYGIPGNHDIYGTSYVNKPIFSTFNSFCRAFPSQLNNISFKAVALNDPQLIVCGIPYITYNADFEKAVDRARHVTEQVAKTRTSVFKKILLIHTDLHGALDPDGREVGTVENIPQNLGKFFKGFDKVFAGHIHKFGALWGDKVYMVGAPNQQRKSDSGCDMGYLLLYDDGTVKQVKTEYPEFRYYKEGDEIDDYHYWTKVEESKVERKKKTVGFSPTKDRSSLAKAYMKNEGVKSKRRLTELIDVLNKAHD